MELILWFIGISAGVIGWYKFRGVINICGEMLAKENQGHYQGAYWCEGCYTWQLPVGHEKHIESCDCNY